MTLLVPATRIGDVNKSYFGPGLAALTAMALFCFAFGQGKVSPELKTRGISNMKQVALAMLMYGTDYDDVLPFVQATKIAARVTEPYCKDRRVWVSVNPNGGQLQLNMCISGVNMTAVEEPAATPLVYDSKPWPDGYWLTSYVDGHCRYLDAARWEAAKKYLKLKLPRVGKPIK